MNHRFGTWGCRRALFFQKHLKGKILDLGCGAGEITQFISGEIIGIDIENKGFKRGKFIQADIEKGLDFEDETFDGVLASELLYYINNREGLIKEIHRVLKKDGVFVGSVINTFSLINKIRFFLEQPEKINLTDKKHLYFFSYNRLKELLGPFREVKIASFGRVKILKDIFPALFSMILGFKCKK